MKIDLNDIVSMSSDKIIGSGRIMLEENDTSQRTVVDIKQLEKVVQLAKDLKWEDVTIRVQEDYPLFVSDMRDDKRELIGILIAPIIDAD